MASSRCDKWSLSARPLRTSTEAIGLLTMSTSTREASALADAAAATTCGIVWGTSWYAITLQLATVDPIASLVYRFSLASALLFAWCRFRGKRLSLSFDQHKAAAGVGLFTFTIDYGFTYFAETHVVSGIVAVLF